MEHSTEASTPEPQPILTNGESMHDLVVADMRERKQFGLEKYGTTLQAGNGRDALVDAYQEALDLCVYLRQAIEERKKTEYPWSDPLDLTQKDFETYSTVEPK